MSERKAASIDLVKGLLNVSLTALNAIGGTTGNPLLAGAAAIPQAVVSSGILKPILAGKQEEPLTLPVPKWWTKEPLLQSWQMICSSIEFHLPAIIQGVEEQIHKETNYLSTSALKQIFIEQVAQQLSPWEVNAQDRYMIAGYITPLLLERSAEVLKTSIDSLREDALATWLEKVATTLNAIQQSTVSGGPTFSTTTAIPPSTIAAPPTQTANEARSVANILEQKRQGGSYDVYICYDEADETEVMDIGEKLKTHGILPWFDLLEIKPGELDRSQEEQQLQQVHTAAVFIGQRKIVEKQELQMYSFINQFLKRKLPVIPVLLTNAPRDINLPPYLDNFGKVDFRRSMPDPLSQLIWGITGKRPVT